jgi:beta-glucosidase
LKKIPIFCFLFALVLNSHIIIGQNTIPDYKNPELSVDKRVDDLLARMTPEEKFWQLFMIPGDLSDGKEKYKYGIFGFNVSTGSSKNAAGQLLDYYDGEDARKTAELINSIQKYFVEETRLGIPIIPFDEALHGLIRKGAVAFPQSIALAATWDTVLMGKVAAAIAMEVKTRGIKQILSPVLNIAGDVRWGRTEETYGEDPFLTSQMGVAYVSQFEKRGIITTPKHFVANVGDGGRDSYPVHYNERILDEIYLPPFKAAIQKGGATSIMTAYNSLNGRQCTANSWLLKTKLRTEWGFNGFVISDAGATGGANVLHFTAKNYAESTKQAIENGLDVIFQTSYNHYPLFWEAFKKGMIDTTSINNAVRNVLRAKFKLGLFENPYVDPAEADKWNGTAESRRLAKQAALESFVLLKNNNRTLPLDKKIKSLAIIGTDATEARLGGYSGPGIDRISILKGIENKLPGSCKIKYVPGCGRKTVEYTVIPEENLSCFYNGKKVKGLKGEYFNNCKFEGAPDLVRRDSEINFSWTLFSPDPGKINYDCFSVRWTGKLTAPQTGDFKVGLEGDDGYVLYLDNKPIIDNRKKQSFRQITQTVHFEKGKSYDIEVRFYETVGNVKLKLIWNAGINDDPQEKINDAVKAAQHSDAAIVVAGIEEGEFRDRAHLSLPGYQEELIKQVAATGKPVIVVLTGGSAITMSNWLDLVPSVIDIWYPGDEGGDAVADVLFGDYNPAGRLPVTFPLFEGQLPLYYNHKPTGRGDDYMDMTGKPLFPFGFGLSYTTFDYNDLTITKQKILPGESTVVSFKITNSGNVDGDEVVQLYIKDLYASVARPVLELKGFKRVHLKKGETKQVRFEITPDMLSMPDINLKKVIEPGNFRIMIGASSNDIRLRTILEVEDAGTSPNR